jgi:tRNA G18 (ribose-2'-O)-methylase SpoU
MAVRFSAFKCLNPICGLRFTVELDDLRAGRCPVCRSATRREGEEFGSQVVPAFAGAGNGLRLEALLDSIRSAWNVGSILRAADGAGLECLHLCGITPLPSQAKVAKTALGAETNIAWQHHPDGVQACRELIASGSRLWALEGGARAKNLFSVTVPAGQTLVLVVGNEVTGIDPGILDLCEEVVCLPMLGGKGSLNVAVAFAAAVYTLRFGNPRVGDPT